MDELRAELLRLELALAQRRAGELPDGYEAVIHPAYRETGASGRSWTREAILELLLSSPESDVAIDHFEVETLAPGLVLATYDTRGARPARRVSIWLHEDGRWQVRFHQGTLV